MNFKQRVIDYLNEELAFTNGLSKEKQEYQLNSAKRVGNNILLSFGDKSKLMLEKQGNRLSISKDNNTPPNSQASAFRTMIFMGNIKKDGVKITLENLEKSLIDDGLITLSEK